MAANSGHDWTHEELKASVEAYVSMLALEVAGEHFSKSSILKALGSGALKERSKGSAVRRMGNISAVMIEMGLQTLSGTPALANVGSNVKNQLKALIRDSEHIEFISIENFPPVRARDLASSKLRKVFGTNLAKPAGKMQPKKNSSKATSYERDPLVRIWVLIAANGKCEACLSEAPFTDDDGLPYLETHHLHRLADNGPDIVENVVAVCPNCHKKLHFGQDRHELRDEILGRIDRLKRSQAE